MNPRLLAYLRSLGLAQDATDSVAWEFYQGLRGVQRSIANCLNYVESDAQARTNCDLAIRALGYDPADPANLLPVETTGERAGSDGASESGDLEATERRACESERARIDAINSAAEMAGVSTEVRSQAIREGWSVERATQAFVADFRGRTRRDVPVEAAPAVHTNQLGMTREVLEAAMLHRSNLDPTQAWYYDDQETPTRRRMTPELERAVDEAYRLRRMSLEDLVRAAARIDNVSLPIGRHGLLAAYCRAASTAALSAIFTTNVNSQLMAAYEVTEDSTTGGWVREADVSDFRTNERARMVNGGALAKLARGGEANHATYEDTVESYKIARYAQQFVIDEQDLIDDNFGGVAGFVPSDMGVAARQLRPDLVYGTLLANANMRDSVALFHAATHGNLITSSALAKGTLQTAIAAMLKQTENGRNLNIQPRFLIVPVALKWTAMELINSALVVVTGSTDSVRGNYNALSSEPLQVVADSRLDNGLTHPATGTAYSGSATTWFLSAAASAHTIEVGYLRGTGRVPTVRSSVLNQGRWGLAWDVKMDIGAKALDWRGLHKATG